MIQWLRLYAPNAGGLGSIPGWGTKISYAIKHGQKKKKDKVPACEGGAHSPEVEEMGPAKVTRAEETVQPVETPALLLSRDCHKWPFVDVDSQISAILGGLEGHILRKKRKIYESLTTSVQNDLKPCYEGGGPKGNVSASSGVCQLL